jgi:DNA invertase Pin-like site-specific DNA recombinase
MMMQMVGSFAEFEREMIRERTKAGLDAARAEGRVGGRRPKLRENQRKDIIENILSSYFIIFFIKFHKINEYKQISKA